MLPNALAAGETYDTPQSLSKGLKSVDDAGLCAFVACIRPP